MKIRFILAAAMLLLSACMVMGCASITQGSTQSIAVSTNPTKDAECKLANENGSWDLNHTPGSTTIKKASGPLTVTCNAGRWGGTTSVESTTAGAAFGNIIAGGIIGAAVDMGSGAAYIYPSQVTVPLSRK